MSPSERYRAICAGRFLVHQEPTISAVDGCPIGWNHASIVFSGRGICAIDQRDGHLAYWTLDDEWAEFALGWIAQGSAYFIETIEPLATPTVRG